jgi:iron complex outermembrane recepter protein
MKHFISIFLSLTFFVVFPSFSLAQDKEVTLEKVVVTATRDEQEIRKIPANVTVITKEKIAESNAQAVTDVLKDEVGVVVRDLSGTGKNASVDIRGFGETGPLNTLVLVDGRRVNEIDLSGVDWTQIPLDQVERIEVVRGPGSVLYGDNAVGGVINIITKKPEKPFSAKAEVVGGSYGYHKESGSVGGKWGPLSAILNTDYSSTEGYRENGFLRAKNVGGKLIYDLNDDISFNFSGGLHRDDSGLPGALPKDIYEEHRKTSLHPFDHLHTDDGYGVLGLKAGLFNFGRIEADLSYRLRSVTDFFASSFGSIQDERKLRTWGWTPKYIFEKSLGNFSNKLTMGLDFYYSNSDIFSDSIFLGFPSSDHSEVTKKSTGIYLFDEFSILKSLILSLGYRHEWVTYDLFQESSGLKERVRENEPAWSVGLDYLFDKRSSVFLSVKRSFRFPVSDELIALDLMTFKSKLNTTMKPQTGYHYEAGIRYAFTDQIEANLTLFWVDLHDEIFFNPETFNNENYPKTRRQGIELGTKVRPFSWLLVWANYGYIRPILRSEPFSGNDIPAVPRHKGSIGTDINFGKGFELSTKANIVGRRHFISDWANQVEPLHVYYSLDAKLSYSWKGLKAFVGVNNLTSRKYAEYGVLNFLGQPNYYPSPERNFFGGVSYTF